MKTYTVGTQIFCDFHFSGKPTGRVIEVVKPGNGRNTVRGECRVKILRSNHSAYNVGAIIHVPTWQCVPCAQEISRSSIFRYVNTDFEWV